MMLAAGIAASHQTNERVLELAARVVELDQVELRVDHRATDVRTAILVRREREQESPALLVRLGDLADALDLAEEARDHSLGVVDRSRPYRHRDLANLAL